MSLSEGVAVLGHNLFNARSRRRQRMRNEHFEDQEEDSGRYMADEVSSPKQRDPSGSYFDKASKFALLAFAIFYFLGWLGIIKPSESETRMRNAEATIIDMQYSIKAQIETNARLHEVEVILQQLKLDHELLKSRQAQMMK
jgi:hypothetical protein